MPTKAVFLDRDGTVIQERGHIGRIRQVKFIRGSATALRSLQELGFRIIVVSNQSGVARGIITDKQVKTVNRFMRSELRKKRVKIDRVFYCPHHPRHGVNRYVRACKCRKPLTGMIDTACKSYGISLKNSYVVGDKIADVLLGKNAGSKSILVLTGFGRKERSKVVQKSTRPDYIAKSIVEAAKWIARDSRNGLA
ncbi:MAG: HAD family hydrolase [candidate division Zixibacteria bacterium]|nr:HAD family hydrolase [candidate division Zixibacteria bacterium]